MYKNPNLILILPKNEDNKNSHEFWIYLYISKEKKKFRTYFVENRNQITFGR